MKLEAYKTISGKRKPLKVYNVPENAYEMSILRYLNEIGVDDRYDYQPVPGMDFSELGEGEEWHAERRKGIGGSESAIIMEINKYGNKLELHYQKKGVIPQPETDDLLEFQEDPDKWFILDYGHTVEALVVKMFEHKTGLTTYNDAVNYTHPFFPWMRANLDRMVIMPDGSKAILEIKTASYMKRDEWKNRVPPAYECQVRHYMAIMNVDVAFIACMFSNMPSDYVCHRIDRDKAIEDKIISAEMKFWLANVEQDVEPTHEEIDADYTETIERYTGIPKVGFVKSTTVTDEDVVAAVANVLIAQDNKSAAAKKAKEADDEFKKQKARLAKLMGDTTKMRVPIDDVDVYINYGTTERNKTDYEKLELVYPDAAKNCVSKSASRTMRISIKEKK